MTTHPRRRFLRTTALAAALVVQAPRLARAQTAVKVGTAVLDDYALSGPIIVALDRGYFSQENLAAEMVPFRGGPALAQAVLSGSVLLGFGGTADVLVSREAGRPLRIVATHTEGNHFTLSVAPDIRSVAELKGAAIGVTQPGSTTWLMARMVAAQHGLEPDRDVKLVALGDLDAQVAALGKGEIRAFVWGDGAAVPQQQGRSKVLIRLDRVTPQWISQVQYASEEAVRRRGDTVRKTMRAIFRALKLVREQPEEFAGVVARRLGWSREAALGAHRISGGLMSADGTISLVALRAVQDTLLEHRVLTKRLPVEEHLTKDFIPVKL